MASRQSARKSKLRKGIKPETTFLHECDPCGYDGKGTEATHFCIDCRYYLCTRCRKKHGKFQKTKLHKMVSENLPEIRGILQTPLRQTRNYMANQNGVAGQERYIETQVDLKLTSTPIAQHGKVPFNEETEILCRMHKVKLCTICNTVTQRNSMEMEQDVYDEIPLSSIAGTSSIDIETTTPNLNNDTEFVSDTTDKLDSEIVSLIEDLNKARQSKQESLDSIYNAKEQCQQAIGESWRKLREFWEKLHEKINSELDNSAVQVTRELSDDLAACSNAINKLSIAKDSLDCSKKAEDLTATMSAYAEAANVVEEVNNIIKDNNNTTHKITFDFELNEKIDVIYEKINSLGKIVVSPPNNIDKPKQEVAKVEVRKNNVLKAKSATNFRIADPKKPIAAIEPAKIGLYQASSDIRVISTVKFSIASPADMLTSAKNLISGCVFLPDGRLVICDNCNSKAKLLDSTFVCQGETNLFAQPWDVALVSKTEVIVTIPSKKELQYIIVGPYARLKCTRSVKTRHSCWGVAVHDDKIFTTSTNQGRGELQVLNYKGHVIYEFELVGTSEMRHNYIAINKLENLIYVSTQKQNVVTCYNMEGDIQFRHMDGDLKSPQKLVVDSAGNIYICGRGSNTVQVISGDGRRTQTLLRSQDGLQWPCCLAIRDADSMLVVSTGMENMQAYKLGK